MIEYLINSLPTLFIILLFLLRCEHRMTKTETKLDIHIQNHNYFLKRLAEGKNAD